MKAPYTYQEINMANAAANPSAIHTHNTGLFAYYVKYLFQKLVSVFEFDGIPENWAANYFKYVLIGYGYITVYDDLVYGTICQQCHIGDTYTLFYQPKYAIITNPVIKSKELEIGRDCELIKLMPSYQSPMDIISSYADLMAIAMETAAVNLLNSKASYIFFAGNQAIAKTYEKLYDEITSGKPFSIIDKSLKDETGGREWEFFTQNVGQNYITDRVLNDIKTIEDQFNTLIGIPNANTQKRERLITSEVAANDVSTRSLVDLWIETMTEGINKVNKRYGLNISVKYRYAEYYTEEISNDTQR